MSESIRVSWRGVFRLMALLAILSLVVMLLFLPLSADAKGKADDHRSVSPPMGPPADRPPLDPPKGPPADRPPVTPPVGRPFGI